MEMFGGPLVDAIVSHPIETSMKKLILASACALALAGGGAMAQMQPAPEASPGVAKHVSKHPTHMKHAKHMKETTGQTTGTARPKETMQAKAYRSYSRTLLTRSVPDSLKVSRDRVATPQASRFSNTPLPENGSNC